MNPKQALALIVLIIILIGGGWYLYTHTAASPTAGGGTNVNIPVDTLVTPAGLGFRYATSTYGLATTPAQILATSYIPPCDPNFDYCLYRTGTKYKGTNFESAGLRIKDRTDLTTKNACLTTLPTGYTGLTPTTRDATTYSTSVFTPIGDAAAGHYAAGALYRLYYSTTCYEFETRIGETQFANYPAGTIKKFTDADRADVYAELGDVLNTTEIAASHTPIVFPAVGN